MPVARSIAVDWCAHKSKWSVVKWGWSPYPSTCFPQGNITDPGNYSPESLTSLVCKTLEHVLVSQIMKHLKMNEILVEEQYRFRSNHSYEAQLFLTIDDLTRALENNLQVDVAILDFEKVFDKVVHTRMTHKLHYYGIRGVCNSGSNLSLLIVHKELLLMVHALLPAMWHQESHKDQC